RRQGVAGGRAALDRHGRVAPIDRSGGARPGILEASPHAAPLRPRVRRVLQVLGLLAAAFVVWLFAIWPPPLWYRTHWPRQTAFMAMRETGRQDGRTAGGSTAASVSYRPVPLDSINPVMQDAVI